MSVEKSFGGEEEAPGTLSSEEARALCAEIDDSRLSFDGQNFLITANSGVEDRFLPEKLVSIQDASTGKTDKVPIKTVLNSRLDTIS
ncbi:MAG: hypothetical protein A2749_00830 [Parcubacteria group bacterium RIFCSPHIGHO2_01_FULL_45_26]|nr:MAG: hypothetical protein A2749_00830 [Parcubacteria group bacterium RIFCSPHIGHO2_01_FULL_45_26]